MGLIDDYSKMLLEAESQLKKIRDMISTIGLFITDEEAHKERERVMMEISEYLESIGY